MVTEIAPEKANSIGGHSCADNQEVGSVHRCRLFPDENITDSTKHRFFCHNVRHCVVFK